MQPLNMEGLLSYLGRAPKPPSQVVVVYLPVTHPVRLILQPCIAHPYLRPGLNLSNIADGACRHLTAFLFVPRSHINSITHQAEL
jgi:hypothetical protein